MIKRTQKVPRHRKIIRAEAAAAATAIKAQLLVRRRLPLFAPTKLILLQAAGTESG
jgi:hypothetical protein